MQSATSLFQNFQIPFMEVNARNWRDELVSEFVEGINKERAKANWQYTDNSGKVKKLQPITKEEVAKRLNRNPFLAGKKNDTEVKALLDKCKEQGFKCFFFVCK